jgi:bifunctional non-homologous end joining protein LigD
VIFAREQAKVPSKDERPIRKLAKIKARSHMQVDVAGTRVELTNLSKVFYPQVGFTKAQVIDYYARVAPALLPHLENRPISLKRYPDGVTGEYFFQKQAPPHRPDWIKTIPVKTGRRQIDYCLINELPDLIWASNLANLELHTFLHRVPEISRPTMLAFDLDPGEGVDILLCSQVGLWIRDLLMGLGITCFPKTSGSKGLQLYVPLNSPVDYEETKRFAHELANRLEKEHPDKVVTKMRKELRVGKVLVDWSQNDEHKTTVCVYSLRATDRPTVSTPVTWDEVDAALQKKDCSQLVFTSADVLDRVEKKGDLFAPVLALRQQIPSLDALAEAKPGNGKSSRGGNPKPDLQSYREKRNFASTSEPEGKPQLRAERSFVVQKHRATRLHYDLRLEMGGVLKSWAVPQGPSMDPAVRRLAVMVEDHPLEYANFEGTIPKGNYGAGEMIIWDRGTYRTEGDILEQLNRGKIVLELDGKKLRGEFHMVKIRSAKGNEWLLIKGRDLQASKEDILAQDRSILTGKRIEEYNNANDPVAKQQAAPQKALSDLHELRPMLAKSADAAFDDPEWIFELKLDGYRALAFVDRQSARLTSRRGTDLSADYPVIIEDLLRMRVDAVLDGEIVVIDQAGIPRFELLQNYKTARQGHLVYYVFDILFLNGRDVRAQPLSERKEILQFILNASDTVRYADHVSGAGIQFFDLVKKMGLEGIIAKKKSGLYLNGKRVDHWLKIKCRPVQDAIICGFTESRTNKNTLGSLLLGVQQDSELRYAGRVGSGLDRASDLIAKLRKRATRKCPFKVPPKADMPVHWVKPELVCSVEFHEWTKAGLMREPSFVSLRPASPQTSGKSQNDKPAAS